MSQQQKPVVVQARPKVPASVKPLAVKQLVAQWKDLEGKDPTAKGKKVRRHLRKLWATTHEDWALTPTMIKALAAEMKVDEKTGKKLA